MQKESVLVWLFLSNTELITELRMKLKITGKQYTNTLNNKFECKISVIISILKEMLRLLG